MLAPDAVNVADPLPLQILAELEVTVGRLLTVILIFDGKPMQPLVPVPMHV